MPQYFLPFFFFLLGNALDLLSFHTFYFCISMVKASSLFKVLTQVLPKGPNNNSVQVSLDYTEVVAP
jgi:hypothetical protein